MSRIWVDVRIALQGDRDTAFMECRVIVPVDAMRSTMMIYMEDLCKSIEYIVLDYEMITESNYEWIKLEPMQARFFSR